MDFQSHERFGQGYEQENLPATAPAVNHSATHIGSVLDISGSASRVLLSSEAMTILSASNDPSLSAAGQVGSQIKVKVGSTWLIANVRTLSKSFDTPGHVVAMIDFLGEGDEERLTGKIYNFRRGVTRYPHHVSPLL